MHVRYLQLCEHQSGPIMLHSTAELRLELGKKDLQLAHKDLELVRKDLYAVKVSKCLSINTRQLYRG